MKIPVQKLILLIITILNIVFFQTLQAQSTYKITNSKDVGLKLSGTSTLHNWTMETKTVSADGQFKFEAGNDAKLQSLQSFIFSFQVKSLKSDKKGLDNNAYESLKADQFKEISFKLISATVVPQQKNKYLIKSVGHLSIAGSTKEIIINVNCQVNQDKTITCTGSQKLNMTDYKVKPPTFMLGAMKTGDEVTIDFILVLKEFNHLSSN
jgi:polyisoprenoid-binding protein YceI